MTTPAPPVTHGTAAVSRSATPDRRRIPLAARGFAWLRRFAVASHNLGFWSAVRLYVMRWFRIAPREAELYIKRLGRPVYFRGVADMGVMTHFFRPGYHIVETDEHPVRFIIDAGANIGDETLRFRHFHPGAFIVALEPAADNFRLLQRNTANDPAIVALQNGLWPRDCRLKVHPGSSNETFRVSEVFDPAEPHDVQSVSIPTLLERFRTAEVDILKMDIEGSEYAVFAENTESWIRRVKVLIFECPDNDHPGATMRIFEALGGQEFDCFLQGECIVLIRRDTGWRLEVDTFLEASWEGD